MNEKSNGAIKISEDVITSIAITAATEIDGVARVYSKIAPSAKSIVSNIKLIAKSISIVTTEDGIELTLQISVKNGYKIPEVCENIQTNVADSVASMTGISVSKVNVIVASVEEKPAE